MVGPVVEGPARPCGQHRAAPGGQRRHDRKGNRLANSARHRRPPDPARRHRLTVAVLVGAAVAASATTPLGEVLRTALPVAGTVGQPGWQVLPLRGAPTDATPTTAHRAPAPAAARPAPGGPAAGAPTPQGDGTTPDRPPSPAAPDVTAPPSPPPAAPSSPPPGSTERLTLRAQAPATVDAGAALAVQLAVSAWVRAPWVHTEVDFGDGSTAGDRKAARPPCGGAAAHEYVDRPAYQHAYAQPGSYQVTVRATAGCAEGGPALDRSVLLTVTVVPVASEPAPSGTTPTPSPTPDAGTTPRPGRSAAPPAPRAT